MRNATLASGEDAFQHAQKTAQKYQARLSRETARREEEEERMDRADDKKLIIENMANGQRNAAYISRVGERVALKLTPTRCADAQSQQQRLVDSPGPSGTVSDVAFVIRGLKKGSQRKVEPPYDSFGGLDYVPKYYVLQDHYEWAWLNDARNDVQYTAGGYNVREYCERALSNAFSGLGVFISDIMGTASGPISYAAIVAAEKPGIGHVKDIK